MFLSNIESIPGKTIEAQYGVVLGSSVRSKHLGRDVMAGLKNLFGGELKAYTELLNESREEAMERMIQQAKIQGANGIVNIRFSTSAITVGAAEILVYGTAVKVS